jgi:hypothetical protein
MTFPSPFPSDSHGGAEDPPPYAETWWDFLQSAAGGLSDLLGDFVTSPWGWATIGFLVLAWIVR